MSTDDTNGDYLLDTSFLIHLLYEKDDAVTLHSDIRGREVISTVALYELHKGSNFDPGEFEEMYVVGFCPEDAEAAGEIWRSLKSNGKPIGGMDTVIGGIALHRNLTVVTDNTKRFERIDGLSVREYRDRS